MPSVNISLDPKAIIDALIQGLISLLTPLPNTFLGWLGSQLTSLWNDLWDSGANLLATPAELTINFPPAQLLGRELFAGVYAIAALAVVLLALRNVWGTMTGHGSTRSDAIGNVLLGVLMSSVSTIVLAQAFYLCKLASDAIGRLSYKPTFDPQTAFSIGPSFALSVITLTVMMVYGWKLMVRAAYRIVLLMFLSPFAPVAGALWAIPQTRWLTIWYWNQVGGWLAGGFLAIGAVSLGVQIASIGNTNGVLSLIFGVALIQVAYDLMGALPGRTGGPVVPSPISGLVSLAFAGGAGAAAAAEATPYVDFANVGALPAAGETTGLGY